jgi:hypothetical protein
MCTPEKKRAHGKDGCPEIYINIGTSFFLHQTYIYLTENSNFCKQKFKWIENKIIWLIYNTVSSAQIAL